jgi:hypothetical protein
MTIQCNNCEARLEFRPFNANNKIDNDKNIKYAIETLNWTRSGEEFKCSKCKNVV